MIEPLAKRVADLGWHVQIHMRADQIVENAALLEGLPTPVVFDHLGRLPQPAPLDHPAFARHPPHDRQGPHLDEALRRLHGHECRRAEPTPTSSPSRRPIIKAAPERVVWGSDWPHPTEKPRQAGRRDAVRPAHRMGAG